MKTRERRVYKPIRFGEGLQPGTVEWEQNRRTLRKELAEDERPLAEMEATRDELERKPRSI
jgi:hypothetical protein